MAALLVGLLILFSSLSAKDFGTYGHAFEIEEKDLLVWLKNKIKTLSEEEAKLMQKSVAEHYKEMFQRPSPLDLTPAKICKVIYLDPRICADQDIKNHEGKVIVKKRSCFNPLEQIQCLDALLFFDATDEKQLAWARQQNKLVKWVLTKGKPLELEQTEEKTCFF